MARPGLWDEIQKRNLVDQARVICGSDGSDTDKASQMELLLAEAGSDFSVTPRAVFIVRNRFKEQGQLTKTESDESLQRPHAENKAEPPQNKAGAQLPKKKPKPPPGPNKGSIKRGDPRAAQPGNTRAVKTGEWVNPLLHGVKPEEVRLVQLPPGAAPADLLRQSIELYRLKLIDMNREIEAIKASKFRWWWLGSTYTRQEGDGEIMGTGRISQRKRVPKEEALKTMVESLTRVQKAHDKAVKDLFDMEKGEPPGDPQAGLKALAEAIKSSKERLTRQDADEPVDDEGDDDERDGDDT